MQKAFGRHLLAADDASAARLAVDHGLSCVTLAGAVSSKGSLSGGWGEGEGGGSRQARWRLQVQAEVAQVGRGGGCPVAVVPCGSSDMWQ